MGQTRLILASASPRRRELLQKVGLSFEVDAPHVDEAVHDGEEARAYVQRVCGEKARHVAQRHPGALVLAADTTVVLGERILGKPAHAADAVQMLRALSGREHRVLTGVALAGSAELSELVTTQVRFRSLSDAEIHWYVATGEPLDKAGAYAIQGAGGAFVDAIQGSHSNVIGLPLSQTLALLERAGWTLPWGKP